MINALIRNVTPGELAQVVDLYLTARNDMLIRNGAQVGPVTAEDRAGNTAGYQHILQTGIMRVAEVDGQVSGVALAIVRDGHWFLSGFWVHPAMQGQGIGGPLLRTVWEEGAARGARTYSVWASSDKTALASYMKLGMLPWYQLVKFGGPVAAKPRVPVGYETEDLPLSTAVAIDERVRGTGREMDHLWWQLSPEMRGSLVTYDGRPVGYFYRRGGAIGPVAWLEPADAEGVLGLAVRQAAAEAGEISLIAPGAVQTAIRMALGAGLKLTGFSHFLTTAPAGMPDRYLPSGPLLY
ncbi:MAG: Acetyltransferase family protein [Symbiobacteriaceae bacterium]|nr:Acetyltransferase family protein [Symbiobacteriaceae bacterium]